MAARTDERGKNKLYTVRREPSSSSSSNPVAVAVAGFMAPARPPWPCGGRNVRRLWPLLLAGLWLWRCLVVGASQEEHSYPGRREVPPPWSCTTYDEIGDWSRAFSARKLSRSLSFRPRPSPWWARRHSTELYARNAATTRMTEMQIRRCRCGTPVATFSDFRAQLNTGMCL